MLKNEGSRSRKTLSPSSLPFLYNLSRNGTHNISDGVEQEARKRQIFSHNYKSTDSEMNFYKYDNVIFFEGHFRYLLCVTFSIFQAT